LQARLGDELRVEHSGRLLQVYFVNIFDAKTDQLFLNYFSMLLMAQAFGKNVKKIWHSVLKL
jgi:hypothetical protein